VAESTLAATAAVELALLAFSPQRNGENGEIFFLKKEILRELRYLCGELSALTNLPAAAFQPGRLVCRIASIDVD
jgi:hypothetical protein